MKYSILSILLLVCITVVALSFMPSLSTKEHFQQRTLEEPAEARQRGALGMERCEILYSTNSNISAFAFNTMTSYVGGHRIKKWKPDPSDPAASNIRPGFDYCYFYNDVENQVQDYAMRNNTCGLSNPMFSNTPIITKAFKTNFRDKAHTIPVEKCVIEINREAAIGKPKDLEAMWTRWGKTDCDQLVGDVRNDIESTKDRTIVVNGMYASLHPPFITNSNIAVQKSYNLGKCQRSNLDYYEQYRKLSSNYDALVRLTEVQQESVTQQKRQYNLLYAEGSNMAVKRDTQKKAFTQEQTNAKNCKNAVAECDVSKDTLNFNYTVTLSNNQYLGVQNIVLSEDINKWTQNYYKMSGLVQTCSNNVASERSQYEVHRVNYTNSNNLYVTCQKERATYSNNATQMLGRYESYSNQFNKCMDDVFQNTLKYQVEQETLTKCLSRVGFLETSIEKLRKTIEEWKAEYNRLNNENNQVMQNIKACEAAVGELENTVEELTRRRDAMLKELDNMNKAAKDAEQKSYDGQLDAIKEANKINMEAALEATMRAAELSCAAVQSRATDLRNQITSLKVAHLEASAMPTVVPPCPSSCTPSRKQCAVYANKLCPPPWKVLMAQDDKFKGKKYEISANEIGRDGLEKDANRENVWYLPMTPFGTSSFQLTVSPFYKDVGLVMDMMKDKNPKKGSASVSGTYYEKLGNKQVNSYRIRPKNLRI